MHNFLKQSLGSAVMAWIVYSPENILSMVIAGDHLCLGMLYTLCIIICNGLELQ